jgi:hypothetical protein
MMLQMLRDPAFRPLVPGADFASIERHISRSEQPSRSHE